MHRSSISNATLIILFSMLTILIQFGVYYFTGAVILTSIIAVLVCLLCCHILLEQTLSYDTCFSYSLLNIFISTLMISLSYFSETGFLLPFKPELALFVIVNWSVPLLYCIIRSLTDHSSKYSDFKIFYRNINIVFVLFYLFLMVILLFLNNMEFVQTYARDTRINFTPFITIATAIEDYFNEYLKFGVILKYLLQGTLIFLPYGFYITLLLRYRGRIIRLVSFLILPVLVELLQLIFVMGKVDIDDIILGLLGGFMGAFLYHIINRIYLAFTEEDFLYERRSYSFGNHSLYF